MFVADALGAASSIATHTIAVTNVLLQDDREVALAKQQIETLFAQTLERVDSTEH